MSKYGIAGEDGTGFVKGGGSGKCGNCQHMQHDDEANGCMHPIMIDISKLKRNRKNYPIVEKGDRCTYVQQTREK